MITYDNGKKKFYVIDYQDSPKERRHSWFAFAHLSELARFCEERYEIYHIRQLSTKWTKEIKSMGIKIIEL